ncbi:MAG: phosphatidylserine synthase [Pseudomonadota bacterium]|jgi:CDP-diacylglycerol--serine O-phosphatidyltransferase
MRDRHHRRRQTIYLLPNLLTTACLFSGFYAMVMAMSSQFTQAAVAIFVAMVLDSLDGRVARLTNTASDFGANYDSLSDMVSFGVAPALIVYVWVLKDMGKLGWFAAFIYVAGAALRLARFNTNIEVVDKRFFQGLPSPAGAALVAGFVWLITDLRETKLIDLGVSELAWVVWGIMVYAGVTMVSNVPFYSFKDANLRRSVPFIFIGLGAVVLVLISQDPPSMLFVLVALYSVSGYAMYLWQKSHGRTVSLFADDERKDL